MRVLLSPSACPRQSSLRFSACRSMTLPAKPTNWLGSRSGASKRRKFMGVRVPGGLKLEGGAQPFGHLAQVLATVGFARILPPDRRRPAGVARRARHHVHVKLADAVAEDGGVDL